MQTEEKGQQSGHEATPPEQDDLLIELLGEGWTHQRVADSAGVSTKTVQRRMNDPAFAAVVSRRRRERVAQVSGRLITTSDRAIDVLREALESDDPKVSLRAAALVLDHGHRFHQGEEARELARRQEELEQRLQEALDAMAGITGSGYEGGQQ
jgi:hypothetical protein